MLRPFARFSASLGRTVRSIGALESRNFRIFLLGQFVSLCGTWIQNVALAWLVLTITDSTLQTGLVTTLGALPVLLFTLYGGVIADRVNKRRWLIVLQTLFLVEAIVLWVLSATGAITVGWIYVLAAATGTVSAFEIPIRQAFLVEMVGKSNLMSAIALNSSVFNLSRVVGPALAGVISAAFGPAACFLVNAVSFAAVLIGLYRIDASGITAPGRRRAGYRAGVDHVLGLRLPRALVTMTTMVTLFGASLVAILPAFAGKDLDTQVGGYGGLMASFGVGAALGALTLAALGGRFPRERVAFVSAVGLGVSLLLLGTVHVYSAAVLFLILTGLCMAMNAIMTNTILQTSAPDHIRGQVVGLYSFIVIGLAPFGSAQASWVGERFGAAAAIALGGTFVLAAALLISWRMGVFGRGAVAGASLRPTGEHPIPDGPLRPAEPALPDGPFRTSGERPLPEGGER
ncbi:MAG: MFS transporter [Gemmatimonadales bacterium]